MIVACGFHPHWVSTLYIGVHVCCLWMMLYSAFIILGLSQYHGPKPLRTNTLEQIPRVNTLDQIPWTNTMDQKLSFPRYTCFSFCESACARIRNLYIVNLCVYTSWSMMNLCIALFLHFVKTDL